MSVTSASEVPVSLGEDRASDPYGLQQNQPSVQPNANGKLNGKLNGSINGGINGSHLQPPQLPEQQQQQLPALQTQVLPVGPEYNTPNLTIEQLFYLYEDLLQLIQQSNIDIAALEKKQQAATIQRRGLAALVQKQMTYYLAIKYKVKHSTADLQKIEILAKQGTFNKAKKSKVEIIGFGDAEPHQLKKLHADSVPTHSYAAAPYSTVTATAVPTSTIPTVTATTSRNGSFSTTTKARKSSNSFSTATNIADTTAKATAYPNIGSPVTAATVTATTNSPITASSAAVAANVKAYSDKDIILKLSSIRDKQLEFKEAKTFIETVVRQIHLYDMFQAKELVQNLFVSVEKSQYGTDYDLRYAITDEIIKTFKSDDLKLITKSSKIMMRVNNWLRHDLKFKNQSSVVSCLRFIKELKLSETELTAYKIQEILNVALKKEEGEVKELVLSIINHGAELKNKELQERKERVDKEKEEKKQKREERKKEEKLKEEQLSKKSADQAQRSTSQPSENHHFLAYLKSNKKEVSPSDILEKENSDQQPLQRLQRPKVADGALRSILKTASKSKSQRKRVSFPRDNSKLVQVREFASEYSTHSKTSVKSIKAMETSEAKSLKLHTGVIADSENSKPNEFIEQDCSIFWNAPAQIDLTAIANLDESNIAETRGGCVKVVATDDSLDFVRPRYPQTQSSPGEPEGLVTAHAIHPIQDPVYEIEPATKINSEDKQFQGVINSSGLQRDTTSSELQESTTSSELPGGTTPSTNKNPDQDVLSLLDDDDILIPDSGSQTKPQQQKKSQALIDATEKIKSAFLLYNSATPTTQPAQPKREIEDITDDDSSNKKQKLTEILSNIPRGPSNSHPESRQPQHIHQLEPQRSADLNGPLSLAPSSSSLITSASNHYKPQSQRSPITSNGNITPSSASNPILSRRGSSRQENNENSYNDNENTSQSKGVFLKIKGAASPPLAPKENVIQQTVDLRRRDIRPWVHTQDPHNRKRYTQKCMFFNTKSGCKTGDSCIFLHIPH